MMQRFLLSLCLCLLTSPVWAACSAVPNTFVAGTTAQAGQVNADFAAVVSCANNIDTSQITSGQLPIARGGTSAATAAAAFTALVAPASSLAGSGYVTLTNGLIVQWGSFTLTSTSTTVTLPITCPTQMFAVVPTIGLTAGTANSIGLGSVTTSNFQVNVTTNTAAGGYFIAVCN